LDVFICNNLYRLHPEDISEPIDLSFFVAHKEDIYLRTREIMYDERLIDLKKPLFILLENLPFLTNDDKIPNWENTLEDVREIVLSNHLTKKEIYYLFERLKQNNDISVVNNEKIIIKNYEEFKDDIKNLDINSLKEILCQCLFSYLQHHKKNYLEANEITNDSILNIGEKSMLRKIGGLLKSKISLEIILLSDGSLNTSQISKKIGKSIATISTYANRLKKMGIIRVIKDGKLKRNLRGIKVNFDLGIPE